LTLRKHQMEKGGGGGQGVEEGEREGEGDQWRYSLRLFYLSNSPFF